MNELALFAGAGGGILGTKLLGWRVVCAVEINPYCREVLLRRQEEEILEPFPIWDDIRTFDGNPWRGKVDVVTAGFPCQPHSSAGRRKGADDPRNLWPDTARIIDEVRPRWVLLENVDGIAHRNRGLPAYAYTVLADLTEIGYDAKWGLVPAAAVGAPHLRWRWWCLAYPAGERLAEQKGEYKAMGRNQQPDGNGPHRTMANATKKGLSEFQRGGEDAEFPGQRAPYCCSWWATEPKLGRVAHGVANRVDRLKALGEGQVPAVVRAAGELLGCNT